MGAKSVFLHFNLYIILKSDKIEDTLTMWDKNEDTHVRLEKSQFYRFLYRYFHFFSVELTLYKQKMPFEEENVIIVRIPLQNVTKMRIHTLA